MESRDTQEFGMLAVTLGYLTREQLRSLIDEQRRLQERGVRKRVGEICLEKRLLTKDQVLLVLRAQGKRVLTCTHCRKSYNVRMTQGEPHAPCKHCGGPLTEPARPETRVVGSATLPAVDRKPATTRRAADSKLRNLLPGYEVLELLGRGGMGQVYKARDLILDRVVAVKLLASDLARDEEYVKRFIREARTAQKLHHANIVQAYDCGVAENRIFFLMEFVDGQTLDELLERCKIPEKRALEVVRQAAEGLDYAWREHRLVHRDIKPQNLLVTRDWEVKICDLGLSKEIGADLTLTMTGQINCTPAYSSPEQGRGMRDLDCRADVYSLGCTLYHMLAGEIPFQGEGPGDLILKHATEPRPNPQARNPTVSRQAAQLTLRMMAVDPKERPTPTEVAQALRKYLAGRSTAISKRPNAASP